MTKRQILKQIGNNIRKARVNANMTQEGVAELIDVHWKTLGYIESGKRDFGASVLAKLVFSLAIPLSEVFEGVSYQNQSKKLIGRATVPKRVSNLASRQTRDASVD